MSGLLAALEARLAAGQDNALLRFGLGREFLSAGNADLAVEHLARAVEFDPGYSAAWSLLGKAHHQAGRMEGAREAYAKGIAVAEGRGDMQAAKQMRVFLNRLGATRQAGSG